MCEPAAREKKVLIVAPHFPPSNLAGVHRSRLFAQHLSDFGWEPIILTVRPEYYEEELDPALSKLVPLSLRIEAVGALPTKPIRIVGDIGIRGFLPMLRRALALARKEKLNFVLIPVPSFYAALLGPVIKRLSGVPYGIDFIDPWVQPPTGREGLKAALSLLLGRLLEPVAVGQASLITGVADAYYAGVLERNPRIAKRVVTAAMPYGGEARDHERVRELRVKPYLFENDPKRFRVVFAGALMPRAQKPLEQMCEAISRNRSRFADCEFVFIGTGKSPLDPNGHNIRPVAERYGLWNDVITEYPKRIPYLDTLAHLEAADAVLVLGSTEPHYTPSKVYQAVLSRKPILAILHRCSTGVSVVEDTGAGLVLRFDGEDDVTTIGQSFGDVFAEFKRFAKDFNPLSVKQDVFELYSARNMTAVLAAAVEAALKKSKSREWESSQHNG